MAPTEGGSFSLGFLIGSVIAAILVVTLAATSMYFGYAAYRLTVDYHGLTDPSPNVDAYWPGVVNVIYKICAAIAGLLTIIIGAFWGYCSQSRWSKINKQRMENRT